MPGADVIKATLMLLYEGILGYITWIVEMFTKKPKSMVGKVVVVTGGASGIGKEIAQMFSNLGAKIALIDVNAEMNEKSANEINENAGLAISFTADVTKPEQMRQVALKVQQHPNLGDPDVLICNAGILLPNSIVEQPETDIRRTIEVNLLGYFWTIRAFLPRMMELNRGHIAAISSVSGYFGTTNMSAYSASKYGVRGLMESLEWELYDAGKRNMKVTVVYPYFTKTPLLHTCDVKSRIFKKLTVEETAAVIVNAIIYEKNEAYTSSSVSIWCNALKATAPQQLKKAFKNFTDIRCK